MIAQLIHLNGPPGIGKSALARRYLDDHPLALLLEIDTIRTSLGRWSEYEESKLVARDLAVGLAQTHLRTGHDVVVPQYLGRMEFIATLENVAERTGACFVEVLLEADLAVNADRFRSRRKQLLDRGEGHPQADVLEDAVESALADAAASLDAIASQRPTVIRIRADGELDQTSAALTTAIEG